MKENPTSDFTPKEIPQKYQTLFVIGLFVIALGTLAFVLCSIG